MFLLAGAIIGLLAGLASGGSLRALATIKFKWPLVVVGALLIKELGIFSGLRSVAPVLYPLSLAVLVAWTLWHYRELAGIWLVSLGMALNLIVIAVNGGRMPVSRELAEHGPHEIFRTGFYGQYVLAGPDTRLQPISDVIGLPGPIGRIFPQAYSPGDLVAFLGMAVVLFLATRRRPLQLPDRPPQNAGV